MRATCPPSAQSTVLAPSCNLMMATQPTQRTLRHSSGTARSPSCSATRPTSPGLRGRRLDPPLLRIETMTFTTGRATGLPLSASSGMAAGKRTGVTSSCQEDLSSALSRRRHLRRRRRLHGRRVTALTSMGAPASTVRRRSRRASSRTPRQPPRVAARSMAPLAASASRLRTSPPMAVARAPAAPTTRRQSRATSMPAARTAHGRVRQAAFSVATHLACRSTAATSASVTSATSSRLTVLANRGTPRRPAWLAICRCARHRAASATRWTL